MWLMLLGLMVAVVLCVLSPEARRPIAWIAAAIVGSIALYIAADVMRSFREIRRANEARKLISTREVTVDDLQLTGTSPATYRLRGLVHNLSPTYTLTLARFEFIVQDCVAKDECHEQGRGHAEVIREVKPNQAASFSTQTILIHGDVLPPPRGERRLIPTVWLTSGK